MPKVVFTPSGKRGEFSEGTSLLDAARRLGVDLDSICGGRGICGRCQVTVAEGSFAKHGIVSAADHVTAAGSVEARYREKRDNLSADRRLGCQAKLCADVVVDVPPESQVHRQVVRKAADRRPIEVDPVVHLHLVDVAQPDMDDPSSDFRRLQQALTAQWGLPPVTAGLPVLTGLQAALRKGDWRVTCAVRKGGALVGVWPGFVEEVYGLAVDVGSTTIAMHLCALSTGEVLASSGLMNPQIRFGEDLMSRVSYAMMNPGGDREMTAAVRGALGDLARAVAAEAGVPLDRVVETTIVGNPIMHHLVLGLDPVELGQAPFALTLDGGLDVPAGDLGLPGSAGAMVYVLPCIAGHVGADAAAVVLADAPQDRPEVSLVVDVGTNAEIVLGNSERLLACSSPTGPAFEGAQVSSGQRAAPGAIERIRIDRDSLEPRFKVIGCDLWSDEPGFPEATAAAGVTGICGSGIIEVIAELFLAGVITADGQIDGTLAARTPRIVADGRTFRYVVREGEPTIAVTQGDVRAIQLAKAALNAGVHLLMDRYGIDHVDRIGLAGAFGSHIDPVYAMVLGLIPDCEPANVAAIGNAAGTGARIALVSDTARRRIEEVVRRIEKVETATEPAFQEHFVACLAIPHKTDPYPRLRQVMAMPEPATGAADAADGRGRREGRRRRERG
jgi:uncharacterized 2Fe-2S/4Fe-4S cluster protein (DUF4445 family)